MFSEEIDVKELHIENEEDVGGIAKSCCERALS